MTYGRKENTWYVNSAQGWPRDLVDETFGRESRGDGSVSLSYIGTITRGADLKGAWEISSYIERRLLPLPEGKGGRAKRRAARKQAQQIMREYPIPTTDIGGVPYIPKKAELDRYLNERPVVIREGQLQRAAALNRRPVQIWHGLPCKPPGDDHRRSP